MYIEEVNDGRRRRRDNEEKEVFRGNLMGVSLSVSLAYGAPTRSGSSLAGAVGRG